ncbi:MAG: hypothetical protein QOH12_1348 [Solirubrobacteraceae bacterium]|jgi:hypothetical protein|nr:hypothetical protein [Solirubrobacteraceae bacterium]
MWPATARPRLFAWPAASEPNTRPAGGADRPPGDCPEPAAVPPRVLQKMISRAEPAYATPAGRSARRGGISVSRAITIRWI